MKNIELPKGFEWCRKKKYDVYIELACYPIRENNPLLDDFEEKVFNINGVDIKYAVKTGFNVLEQNMWTTGPNIPYVITGTVKERWPVKLSNLKAYDVDPTTIGISPIKISTKNPEEQEFLVAVNIPIGMSEQVIPCWAFRKDGTIDESQIMIANSKHSTVSHNKGDYIVAKHIPKLPEYIELNEDLRKKVEIAKLYDPRIVNGTVMETTYDHAVTQLEIIEKYNNVVKRRIKK